MLLQICVTFKGNLQLIVICEIHTACEIVFALGYILDSRIDRCRLNSTSGIGPLDCEKLVHASVHQKLFYYHLTSNIMAHNLCRESGSESAPFLIKIKSGINDIAKKLL